MVFSFAAGHEPLLLIVVFFEARFMENDGGNVDVFEDVFVVDLAIGFDEGFV